MIAPLEGKTRRDNSAIDTRAALLRLWRYMAAYRARLIMMLVLLLVGIVASLSMPLAIEGAMNAIAFGGPIPMVVERVGRSLILFLGLAFVNAVTGVVQERISADITLGMSRSMRRDAYETLLNTSVFSFERMRRGDLMSRMSNDCDLAAGAFTQSFKSLLSSLACIVGCMVIMVGKDVRLALVSLACAVVSVVVMSMLSRLMLPRYLAQQTALGELNAHVEESLKAFRTCVVGGRMEENKRRMATLNKSYYDRRIHAILLEQLMGPIMLVLSNLNFLAIVMVGALQVMEGVLAVGTLQAFIMYSRQLMEPLNALSENLAQLQNALAGAERVFVVMDMPDERLEIDRAKGAGSSSVAEDAELQVEGLTFAYHRNHPVLKGFDLTVHQGEHVALVGRTGEGKTTLANLLLLFYPTYGGTIGFKGRDLRSHEVRELRRKIGVVPQDPQVIDGTVLENLLYGNDSKTRADAERLMADIGLADLVDRLPQGLDTAIETANESLSQGELQLVCLARVLLQDADLLILDEATSSVDPMSELAVRRGYERSLSGRTSLVIAHRLQTLVDADRIVVLSDGVVTDVGTHADLMARGGIYRELYTSQYLGKEI